MRSDSWLVVPHSNIPRATYRECQAQTHSSPGKDPRGSPALGRSTSWWLKGSNINCRFADSEISREITHMGVSENSVPLNRMVLLIIIPIKWLFHWEYTLFSDKPTYGKWISGWIMAEPSGGSLRTAGVFDALPRTQFDCSVDLSQSHCWSISGQFKTLVAQTLPPKSS